MQKEKRALEFVLLEELTPYIIEEITKDDV